MGAMGERFTLYRLPEVDPDVQAREALRHSGRERAMRLELGEAARAVLATLAVPRLRTDDETDHLIALATFVVRARSAVERDGYSRDIELVPGPEAPTRLVIVLDRLLGGLDALGCNRDDAFRVVIKSALDSVPALRLAVLDAIHAEDDLDTNVIAEAVRHPATTTRRALEDLTAHGLIDRRRGENEKDPHRWSLTPFARTRLDAIPEMSSNTRSGRDKSSSPVLTFREQHLEGVA
jgi:DNA-binding MarR family transcriptional regulator